MHVYKCGCASVLFGTGQRFWELAKDLHVWVQLLSLTQPSLSVLTKHLKNPRSRLGETQRNLWCFLTVFNCEAIEHFRSKARVQVLQYSLKALHLQPVKPWTKR